LCFLFGQSNHAAFFAKEIQSPRFQAILRVTSGRMKKSPDIKSFSHELNSKGVRAFPVWKSRAFGHMEVHWLCAFCSFFFVFVFAVHLPSFENLIVW
jgi:hypothetical protein